MQTEVKRAGSVALLIALLLALLPAPAYATGISTYYIDLDGNEVSVTAMPIPIPSDSNKDVNLGGTSGTAWYVATGEVNIDNLNIEGDVRLILEDDCLLLSYGVDFRQNNASLTIYGQRKGTGTLQTTNHGISSIVSITTPIL